MLPYWLLIVMWTAGAIQFSRARSAAYAKPLFIFAMMLTAGLIGLRYHVGGDWGAYQRMFESDYFLEFRNLLSVGDPAYTVLNWMTAKAGFGVVTVNVVCGIIVAWGLGRFALRQPNPWLTVVIAVPYFVLVVSMGYTRQAAAIGIVMAGLAGLRERSLPKLVGYVFVAALFHKTAVLMLPILAIAVLRRNILAGAASVLVFFLFYYLFLNSTADQLVANYATSDYDSQGAAIRVSMDIVAAAILYLFRNRMGLDEFERAIWLAFAAFAVVCVPALLFASASSGVDRLSLFLIPLQLIALGRLPYAISRQQGVNRPVFGAVIAYSLAVQFIWLNYATNANYWVPYRFAPTDNSDI